MKAYYGDIISRIADKPLWFTETGVPRYEPFDERQLDNIYATEAALVEIACQGCDTRFHVGICRDKMEIHEGKDIASQIRNKSYHYGDPPNMGCCPSGASMNSEPVKVLIYMANSHKEYVDEKGIITDIVKYWEWRRDPEFEISF